ncbi:MAG: GEVED domain-containing protein [Pirellulales bacterium]
MGSSDAVADYLRPVGETHQFVIVGYGVGDYGDAPFESFKSELGAAHRNVGPSLGAGRGFEEDGFVGDLQDDGVTVIGELITSPNRSTVGGLLVTTTADAKLDAWIDFNHDNDWDDEGEQIFVSTDVTAGSNRLSFTIPAGAFVGDTYARFRLSTAGGLAPTGIAMDGEVEDYVFTFESATAADSMTIHVGSDPMEISLEASDIVVRVAGQVVSVIPASSISSLVIEGDAGNNNVTIDAAAIPAGGLIYNGNGSGDLDVLNIRNSGGTIVALNHLFTNAHDGSVEIDGKSIHYTGLEPIIDVAVSLNRTFTFGDDDDVVTLGDSGATNDGLSRVTSVDSSESVDFVNPTVSLTIDLGEGNDTLIFGSLDTGLTVPVTVTAGSGNDTLRTATGDLNLSGKTLKKSDGTLTIESRATGSSFTTDGDFAIALLSGAHLSSPMTFSNTTGVTLGDAVTDVFEFDSGLISTSSVTTVQGSIQTIDSPLFFGDLVLSGDTILTGSTITIGSITGTGNLVLNGAVTLNGRLDIVGTLTINGTLSLGDDAALSFDGTTVLATAIQGSFSLIKDGSGTLRLSNQAFAGQLTVVDGVVELPNGLVGAMVLDGGTAVVAGSSAGGLQAMVVEHCRWERVRDVDDLRRCLAEIPSLIRVPAVPTLEPRYDQVVVTGPDRVVDLNDAVLDLSLGFVTAAGSSFTILSLSDPSSTVSGTFAGLPQDGMLIVGDSQFTIDYAGGDGNDVVLTARATRGLDFGDAPLSYGTLLADDGARHFATGPTLGTNRDSEVDGIASIFGDGDDVVDGNAQDNGSALVANDEDGVTQPSLSDGATTMTVYAGQANVFSILVANAVSGAATLDAWIDWNADGIFDIDERIATRQTVVNGVNTLTFTAPSEGLVSFGTTYARFRISTVGTPDPTGLAEDGEVEDYMINVLAFNDPPTIAAQDKLTLAEDSEATSFTLTGFSRGGEDEPLRLTVTGFDSTLFAAVAVDVGTGTNATLTLTPVPNAFGTGTVNIEARDAGLDGVFDTDDDGVAYSTVTVDVTAVNDAPTGFAETLLLSLVENDGPQRIRLTDITAGPRETDAVTLRVSTDKPGMFKTLSYERNPEDLSVADLILETGLNQRGTAKIFITIDDGLTTTTQTIDVVVAERNDPPTLNPVPVIMLDSGTTHHTVNLTGVTAGANETQTLQLYVVDSAITGNASSTSNIVSSATTSYQSPAATGSLNLVFAAGSRGTGTVGVVVQDAGPDGIMGTADDATHVETVTVVLNNAPTLNTIPGARVLPTSGLQTVSLTGITDGDAAGQLLRVTASSNNTAAVSAPTIVYDESLAPVTGQLQFTPIALGSAVITVTVTDAGWDGLFDTFDDRSFARVFVVNVSSVLYPWQNPTDSFDVDGSGYVSALDVLLLINAINRGEGGDLSNRVRTNEPYYDVSGDNRLSPLDALLVMNEINRVLSGEAEDVDQAALDLAQAVQAAGGAGQSENHAAEVWTDLNWLWDEGDVYGPKRWRAK